MQLRFLGPLSIVTGSCTWMRDTERGWNFLVDCGMQQGELKADDWNKRVWPFDPADIKFVVLTHAHIDHSGLLPRLYKDGFSGTVYCTKETAALAEIVLLDAAQYATCPYKDSDVARINWHEHMSTAVLGGFMPVGQDLFLRFWRSAHIMGAVSVSVVWGPKGPNQRSITFSGDLGPNAEDVEELPYLRHRMTPVGATFAVVESTYGNIVRDPDTQTAEARRAALRDLLDDAIARNGILLLPCFALGRTQDVLFDLHYIVAENRERYGHIAFYLDAPMAARMQKVVAKGLDRTEQSGSQGKVRPLWLGKQMYRWFGLDDKVPAHTERLVDMLAVALHVQTQSRRGDTSVGNSVARAWAPILRTVKKREDVRAEGLVGPSVIVSGGGMCEGGPVGYWLSELLGDPRLTVALTGYCSASTIGGKLRVLGAAPLAERQRHRGRLTWSPAQSVAIADIRARIVSLTGYSAHADQKGLVDWLFSQFKGEWYSVGQTVFVQHGEDQQRSALAEAAQARADELGLRVNTLLPNDDAAWHDLEADGEAMADDDAKARIRAQIAALEKLLKDAE